MTPKIIKALDMWYAAAKISEIRQEMPLKECQEDINLGRVVKIGLRHANTRIKDMAHSLSTQADPNWFIDTAKAVKESRAQYIVQQEFEKYFTQRQQEARGYSFGSKSKFTKLSATEKIIKFLNQGEKPNFTSSELKALGDSRLGSLVAKHKKALEEVVIFPAATSNKDMKSQMMNIRRQQELVKLKDATSPIPSQTARTGPD